MNANEANIVIFKPSNGDTAYEVQLDSNNETIWATELEIASIFDRNRTVINRHIRNSFEEGELDKKRTSAKFARVGVEGTRKIERAVMHYNLDVIISVGYRVKSPLATEFRKWATSKLKEYLTKGYSINENLLKQQSEKILRLQKKIDVLHEDIFKKQEQLTDGFLKLIDNYSKSFELLNKYDSNQLDLQNLNENIIYVIDYKEVKKAISKLKSQLIEKGEASALFGNEKDNSLKGILGSTSQTVFGELAYPTVEQQAAQLLYSIIKGHAFSDGNKRIGSFLFVWFLEQNKFHLDSKGTRKIDKNTLVVLALTVAQSSPAQREIILKLIANLIKKQ